MAEALIEQARNRLESEIKALERSIRKDLIQQNKSNKHVYNKRYVFFVKFSYDPQLSKSSIPNLMRYHKPKYEKYAVPHVWSLYSYNQPHEITKCQLQQFIVEKLHIPEGDYFIPIQHTKSKAYNSQNGLSSLIC